MSTSPEHRWTTGHDRSTDELAGLYATVSRAVTAAKLIDSDQQRMLGTRAVIAQTLRWAAEQLGNHPPTAAWLQRWAEQVDQMVPCFCGRIYDIDDRERHFAEVAHDWDDIPRDLRGLPERGEHDAAIV